MFEEDSCLYNAHLNCYESHSIKIINTRYALNLYEFSLTILK